MRYDGYFRGHKMLEVFYEDLAADPQGQGNRALHFLGLPRREGLQVRLAKMGTDSLRQAIVNYDALKERMGLWAVFFEE